MGGLVNGDSNGEGSGPARNVAVMSEVAPTYAPPGRSLLAAAVPAQETTGTFSALTKANVEAFQTAHAIVPTGVVEAATWAALLALPPVAVNWTGGGPSGG